MKASAVADLIAWAPGRIALARLARLPGGAAVLRALRGGSIGAAATVLRSGRDDRLVAATARAIRWRATRGPVAVALLAALRGREAGLPIAAAAVSAFPRLSGPRCEQLRLMASLGMTDRVLALASQLLPGVTSPAVAFAFWQVLRPIDPALAERARTDLLAHAPIGSYWRLRLYAAAGEVDRGIEELVAREHASTDPAERQKALRDAAAHALVQDRYGTHAPLIARAIAAGATPEPAWRVRGWEAVAARRSSAFEDPPVAAVEWLVRRHLAGVPRYAPENRLMMIGNTLGAGGMERILANTLRGVAAARRFENIHLALTRFDPAGPSAFFLPEAGIGGDDVSVLVSDATPVPAVAGLPMAWVPRAQAVYDRVAATRPRIVHAWNDLTGLIGAQAALAAGAPRVIVHIHHLRASVTAPGGLTEHYPACYRLLLERPEIELLFCSDAAARDYADWWGVPWSPRFRTVRNGIVRPRGTATRNRSAARAALGLPDEGPIIGAAFRFDPVKQPLIWVEAALAILRLRPQARFVMLGDGPLLSAARAAAGAAGAADRFVFPGEVRDVDAWISAMDLFMMTSAIEGLGNGAIEAQFAGVPVVAFDVGGLAETILPGETGWLAPPNDVTALAALAVAAIDDPDRRAALAPIATAHATRRFGMERYMRELLEIYG